MRRPWLALRLARAAEVNSEDPDLLPALDAALGVVRVPSLLRRRGVILGNIGELSRAWSDWQELTRRGNARAASRARIIAGRLRETDPSWLPTTDDRREELAPSSRRRVLHIVKQAAPERWSGFTIRTLNNVRAQRAAGLEPFVATDVAAATDGRVPAVVEYDGFVHHRIVRPAGYDRRTTPVDVQLTDAFEALVPIVREVRPAILHAHSGHRGGEYALVALALRERLGVPVVYEVRGMFESGWTSDRRFAEKSELYARRITQETRLACDADGVVAISESLAQELQSRGVPGTRITVVPNGIDPAALAPQQRDPRLRSELGLDGRFVVGYLGNLDHWREGIDVLIDALAVVHERGRRDIAVLVVGDGSRRADLEERARRLDLGDDCRFTGHVPHLDVGQYYAQMDVFASPRVDERAARYITPLKPYEAMALGIPVLVSDLPALREIVDPPRRGVVAPPGDAPGLATAIEGLVDDGDLRRRLGEAGRQWVLAERTWSSNGPRYRAAYEKILGPID